MSRVQVLPGLASAGYQRHMLHADARLWIEKNCYVDVCIELLHTLGVEPLAVMGATVCVDFEEDNFTFFKPSHDDMRALYGVDFQELNVWRPLAEHAETQLGAGKFISTEADSFYLPDTEGTDYRRNHVKTTIILAELDLAARRLGYFHNAAYHVLDGEDFAMLFRVGAAPDPTVLPLFAEVVRSDRLVHRPPNELVHMARGLLARHFERRPVTNPMIKFQHHFERELELLQQRGLTHYHAWAFATLRQMGSAFELLALHLRWLIDEGQGHGMAPAADDFHRVSAAAKTFVLKAARAVNKRQSLDASATFSELSQCWERGMSVLDTQLAHQAAEQIA
ncbi:MAG: DUF1839 family protein [Gemmatimonadaceae bacterium]